MLCSQPAFETNRTLILKMASHRYQSWTFVRALSLLISTSLAQETSGPWVNSTAAFVSPTAFSLASALTPSIMSSTEKLSSPNVEIKPSNVGDFIAAGIGMSHSVGTAMGEAPPLIFPSNTTKLEEPTPVSASSSMSIISTPPMTTPSSTADQEETSNILITSRATMITIGPVTGNHTISFAGGCWEQWSLYWSADSLASKTWSWYPTLTTTSTRTESFWAYSGSVKNFSGTTTVTVKYGAFVQSTYTTLTKTSFSYSISTSSLITTVVKFDTQIFGGVSQYFANATILQPTCVLPTRVSECQTSWENWLTRHYVQDPIWPTTGCAGYGYEGSSSQSLSCQTRLSSYLSELSAVESFRYHNTATLPSCTQAAITGALCSSVIGEVLNSAKHFSPQKDGAVVLNMPTTYKTTQESNARTAIVTSDIWSWDPTFSVAPGCTLGCQSCQINGGTVKLIHWLPMSSTWIDGTYSAISESSNKTVTVLTLGTTLTSPIVYISFDSLYARDSCSVFDTTYSNKIVAITNTANLSSLYGWNWRNGLGSTASFNFTDL